jgi:hypothetical protein
VLDAVSWFFCNPAEVLADDIIELIWLVLPLESEPFQVVCAAIPSDFLARTYPISTLFLWVDRRLPAAVRQLLQEQLAGMRRQGRLEAFLDVYHAFSIPPINSSPALFMIRCAQFCG